MKHDELREALAPVKKLIDEKGGFALVGLQDSSKDSDALTVAGIIHKQNKAKILFSVAQVLGMDTVAAIIALEGYTADVKKVQ